MLACAGGEQARAIRVAAGIFDARPALSPHRKIPMILYLAKILISAAVFTLITELAKRNTALAALVTALPLTTLLVLFWRHHQEHATPTQLADYLSAALWYVLPSLTFFVAMPWLLRHGWNFYPALVASGGLTVALYAAEIRVLAAFGTGL